MGRRENITVENIDPEFMNLVDKLYITQRLYQKSAERVPDDILKEKMNQMGSRKEVYIKEIAHLFDSDHEEVDDELKKRVKVELDKINIEIDHLVLEENPKSLLNYLLKREDEVNRIYKKILTDEGYSDLENTVIKSQINENGQQLEELQRFRNPFDE